MADELETGLGEDGLARRADVPGGVLVGHDGSAGARTAEPWTTWHVSGSSRSRAAAATVADRAQDQPGEPAQAAGADHRCGRHAPGPVTVVRTRDAAEDAAG